MSNITVDTPSGVTQCGQVAIQWSSGSPSYSVSVLNAQNSFNEPTIATLGNSFDPFLNVDKLPVLAGTLVVFQVTDQSGNSGKSTLVSVASSNDFSCLPADEQPPPSKTPPPKTTQPPPTSPPASPSNGQSQSQSSGGQSQSQSSPSGSSTAAGKSTASGTNSQSPSGSATLSNSNPASSGLPLAGAAGTGGTEAGNIGGDPTGTGSDPGSPSPSGNLSTPPSSSGLSPGILAAIGGGAVVVIIIILAFWLWRRGRRRSQEAMDDWFNPPQHTTQSYNADETPMRSGGGGSAYSMSEYGGAAAVAPAPAHEYYHDRPPIPGAYADEVVQSPTEEYGENPLAPHEYYDSDPKQRRVMRASTYFSDEAGAAHVQRRGTSSSLPRTRSATGTTEVPTNLTSEEMARLADLVASRMRTAPQVDEPPPMYS